MFDVWFGRDCVCCNIEHLSNINEKSQFYKHLYNSDFLAKASLEQMKPTKSQNTDPRESKKQYFLLSSSSPLLSFLFQGAHKSSRCNSKVDAVGEDLLVPRQAHTSIFRQLIMGPDFIQNHHTPIPRIT